MKRQVSTRKIKEKPAVTKVPTEKLQAVPKELLKRGLGTGVRRLQDQLRQASQGDQAEERPETQVETAAAFGVRQIIRRLQKQLEKRKNTNPQAQQADNPASYPDFEEPIKPPEISELIPQIKSEVPKGPSQPAPTGKEKAPAFPSRLEERKLFTSNKNP